LGQVDHLEILFHVLFGDLVDPLWKGCREQADLKELSVNLLRSFVEDLFDIFLETHVEHDISLIENKSFELRKVDVFSFDMVENSSSSANEEIYTTFELASLIGNTDSSIDGHNREFSWIMLQFVAFLSNLDGQLSGRSHENGLSFARAKEIIFPEVLNDWESKGEGLS